MADPKIGSDIDQSGNAWNYNALDIVQGNSLSNDRSGTSSTPA